MDNLASEAKRDKNISLENTPMNKYTSYKDPALGKKLLSNPSLSQQMGIESLSSDVTILLYPKIRELFTIKDDKDDKNKDGKNNLITTNGKDDNRSFVNNYLLIPSGDMKEKDIKTTEMYERIKKRDEVIFRVEMSPEEREEKKSKLSKLDKQALARDIFRRTDWSYSRPPSEISQTSVTPNTSPRNTSPKEVVGLPPVISDIATYCRERFSLRGDSPCRVSVGLYMRNAGFSIEAPPHEVVARILVSFNEEETYTLSPHIFKDLNNKKDGRVSSGLPEQNIKIVYKEPTDDYTGDEYPRRGYAGIYNLGPGSMARYRIVVSKTTKSNRNTRRLPTAPGLRTGKTKMCIRRGNYERVTAILDFYRSDSLINEDLSDTEDVNKFIFPVQKLMSRFSQLSGIEIPGVSEIFDKEKDAKKKEDVEKNSEVKKDKDKDKDKDNVNKPPVRKRKRKRKNANNVNSNGTNFNSKRDMKKALNSIKDIKDKIEEQIPKELIESLTSIFGNLTSTDSSEGFDLSTIENLIRGLENKEEESKEEDTKSKEEESKEEEGKDTNGISSQKSRTELLMKLRRLRHMEIIRRNRSNKKLDEIKSD